MRTGEPQSQWLLSPSCVNRFSPCSVPEAWYLKTIVLSFFDTGTSLLFIFFILPPGHNTAFEGTPPKDESLLKPRLYGWGLLLPNLLPCYQLPGSPALGLSHLLGHSQYLSDTTDGRRPLLVVVPFLFKMFCLFNICLLQSCKGSHYSTIWILRNQ